MDQFAGRLAVVTGGADGIGFAIASALTAISMRTVLLDIREDAVAEAAAALAREGPGSLGLVCDVSDGDALADAAADIAAHMGSPSVICANAGVGAAGGMLSASVRAVDWVLEVNLKGTIHTLRRFVPMLDQAGPRRVCITVSSASLVQPSAELGLYGGSKHGTMGIAEAVAAELAIAGIAVTILCPGLINTRIWDGARARPQRFGGPRFMPEEAGEHWREKGMPVDWVGDEAARAIVNGAPYCIPVDREVRDEFERRATAIRSGFRFWQDRDQLRWPG